MVEPLTDLFEQGPFLFAELALPGILETDIDVTLEADRLVVRAERWKSETATFLSRELKRGVLSREIPLPYRVELLHAVFEDGVLRIQFRRV